MEIETAVEWLNRVEYRGRKSWRVPEDYISYKVWSCPDDQPCIDINSADALIIAQWYAERAPGTWLWALEQMKAGKRVTNSETHGYYSFEQDGAGEFLRLSSPQGEGCPIGLLLAPEDFDVRDWQLAEEQHVPRTDA
jgi:hypothetical protein